MITASRIFQLIRILTGGNYTVPELMKRLCVSRRTVYRYLRTLEDVGYSVDKDFRNRYFIFKTVAQ